MRCADCRESLNQYIDGELVADEAAAVRDHLATCADCAREHAALSATSHRLKEALVRHAAPDVLKARIRSALVQPDAFTPVSDARPIRRWSPVRFAAAGFVIAAFSSALTFAAVRTGAPAQTVREDLLASHIRSLMPGHLTDVVSTNQHNVKPWFNGRVDLSPPVPSLDSAGFPLVGGRLDYVDGRPVAVTVYSRRQHIINVYSWPSRSGTASSTAAAEHGYNLVEWRRDGVDLWAVSDLNRAELDQFVAAFNAVR
jgi:anti-sigma factor RsiW